MKKSSPIHRTVGETLVLLANESHCFLISVVSDEESAVNIEESLYVMCQFSLAAVKIMFFGVWPDCNVSTSRINSEIHFGTALLLYFPLVTWFPLVLKTANLKSLSNKCKRGTVGWWKQ